MTLDGQRLDHYQLSHPIGRGGMGIVYLAQDLRTPRSVAIKVIYMNLPHNEEEKQKAIHLFRREAGIIASMDHPHILPLFDYGEERVDGEDIAYQVMPYRKEGSLDQWLKQRYAGGALPIAEVSRFITQAASALYYAHNSQIIHQDIKPSNFLLRQRPERPERPDLLLADFGIARLSTNTSSSSMATMRGTPQYMAPEQWKSQSVPASDQYALAVMAYQMLTGSTPFQGSPEQLLYQHLNEPPTPPTQLNAHLPSTIDAVLLRALAKEPEQRYPNINTFASELQIALLNSDTPTVTLSPGYIPGARSTSGGQGPRPGYTPVFTQTPQSNPPAPNTPSQHGNTTIPAPPTTDTPAPAGNTSKNKALLTLLLISLVVLLVGGIGSTFLLLNNQPPSKNAHSPATDQPDSITTTTAEGTSPTIPAVTPDVSAAEAAQNPYPEYFPKDGTLLYLDPLTTARHWHDTPLNQDFGGKCTFIRNELYVTLTDLHTSFPCTSDFTLQDFAAEVTMTMKKPGCGGFYFRYNANEHRGYYFLICTDQTYTLYKFNGKDASAQRMTGSTNKVTTLFPVGAGQSHTLGLFVQGNTMYLYVNGQYLDKFTDGTYTRGTLGLAASAQNKDMIVAYHQLEVWQPDA
ncbi:serine/threonine protein kinase [Thermosporothrix hazakensis]|jgi:serine/threonine protein kinase|uniref:non-specific serine/threonine protein kinase n=1 Tax=Thermosporothrix hazakensis TaxID=644383 RepID=A0A326UAR5_THEHA|nr:serine/threonine-protein kinase [Thermosporothrix hazakensis]PZW24868.1 serine/threonine protein kinase [Thermosporothrix hazakensis]GCE46443.1 hypothetical protein KTH_13120 [Thermosporothrix hazakensis]